MDQKAGERTFQANMERRMALLLGEAMGEATGEARRVRRATAIGNNSVQVFVLMFSFSGSGKTRRDKTSRLLVLDCATGGCFVCRFYRY